jgi:hypothetical protein
MWRLAAGLILALAAGTTLAGGSARAAAPSFPDVPPWHWAYDSLIRVRDAGIVIGYPATAGALIEISITQVYDAFAHAGARGAQAWAERFTYNRPADWPAPFLRAHLAGFSLSPMQTVVAGEAASTTFDATVTSRDGQSRSAPMRVQLRWRDGDWQVDYATLRAGASWLTP